jgi:long-subunit fatty acid transport protein
MAFVATADNPSAIYYNPAGIARIDGTHVRGGLYGIYLAPSYEAPVENKSDNEDLWQRRAAVVLHPQS